MDGIVSNKWTEQLVINGRNNQYHENRWTARVDGHDEGIVDRILLEHVYHPRPANTQPLAQMSVFSTAKINGHDN